MVVPAMPRQSRVRYQLFLPEPLSRRFEDIASAPGASKSSILVAALSQFLERRGGSEAEHRFAMRLDRISNPSVQGPVRAWLTCSGAA